ncbi:hypothetical protein CK203_095935 [Vitis vinifera]|uniref:Uncharacterized protein n=1 Tax=Vitis vinifera TaxID=29760 RepID=A0A438DDM1_VITVI|nr:hypothetical protein CK203_095935 [Vitis vinifera]
MDVSLESKSLPSVGNSRKSYLQVTSQRLARGKLVHLHGRRSLALPSVGPDAQKRAAKSLRSKRLTSQRCEVIFQLVVFGFQLDGKLQGEIHSTVQKGCEIISQQKGDFAALCKILPSAWSDRLVMALTSSFQLQIEFLFVSPPCIPYLLMAKDFKALVLHVSELSIALPWIPYNSLSISDCFEHPEIPQPEHPEEPQSVQLPTDIKAPTPAVPSTGPMPEVASSTPPATPGTPTSRTSCIRASSI